MLRAASTNAHVLATALALATGLGAIGQQPAALRDIPYAAREGVEPRLLSLDLYPPAEARATSPTADDGAPVLVMIHGGNWHSGDKAGGAIAQSMAPWFTRCGFLFASINYRLSNTPDVRHPAHVEDVASALAWLSDHVGEYGGDPERMFLMGHSSGAHLALLVSTDERRLAAEGKPLSIVKGVVSLDSAAYDIPRYAFELEPEGSMLPAYERAFGSDAEVWRDASPRHHVAVGKGQAPVLLIHTGPTMQGEQLSNELARALRDAGTPAGVVHADDRDHGGLSACIGAEDDPYTRLIADFLAAPDEVESLAAAFESRVREPESVVPPPYELPWGVSEETLSVLEFEVAGAARERRLPLVVHLPERAEPRPVILFSHGLGGSPAGYGFLAESWAERGYVTVMLRHPGSDDSVGRDAAGERRIAALRRVANATELVQRVEDVSAVLDALEQLASDPDHPLAGRLDLEHVGLGGHSFGAATAQWIGGQRGVGPGRARADARIRAVLLLSPQPSRALDPSEAFGGVRVPWMAMTGTEDRSPLSDVLPAERLQVYPALPHSIDRYELVLQGAGHFAFTERALVRREQRDPKHQGVIQALSSAFWDATLAESEAARAWLQGPGPRTLLAARDRWRWAERTAR